MDKDRLDGKARQVKGSMKEALGKLVGNNQMRAEGAADRAAGKTQSVVGNVKDKARGLFRR